jgi:pimeloyl-ACP methyl ester carboxylesterase
MAMFPLFATALAYVARQWATSLVGRERPRGVPNAGDAVNGPLVHRFITVERTISGKPTGVRFHYVESCAEEGECIVFLHGLMDTWQLWLHQLERLAGRCHCVAFDLKGTGQSSMNYPRRLFPQVNDPGGDYSLEMQADELITALDQMGIRRFNLVTLDLGTIIGDILAGKYPTRILRYMRCQQPLAGHFKSSIPQGLILRNRRAARLFTHILEVAPAALVRILYGRTGWAVLDASMKRSKLPMPETQLQAAVKEASYAFSRGPRAGRPGVFACAWAGLYQHNRDYLEYLRDNVNAYANYSFPVLLVQGTHDIAMPPSRFDGTTGMAFKRVRLPFWMRKPGARHTILSRPFAANGQGLGDGYAPWAGLIQNCNRPLEAGEFFPNAPSVQLKFIDAGHFVPLEAPETFSELLEEFLGTPRTDTGHFARAGETTWKTLMS